MRLTPELPDSRIRKTTFFLRIPWRLDRVAEKTAQPAVVELLAAESAQEVPGKAIPKTATARVLSMRRAWKVAVPAAMAAPAVHWVADVADPVRWVIAIWILPADEQRATRALAAEYTTLNALVVGACLASVLADVAGNGDADVVPSFATAGFPHGTDVRDARIRGRIERVAGHAGIVQTARALGLRVIGTAGSDKGRRLFVMGAG